MNDRSSNAAGAPGRVSGRAAPSRAALILAVAAVLSIAVGYLLLSRGSITAAPLLLVLGYAVLMPAAILR